MRSYSGQISDDKPVPPFKSIAFYGSGTVPCFLYKVIEQSRSRDFASRLFCFSGCSIENWEEPGDEANLHKVILTLMILSQQLPQDHY